MPYGSVSDPVVSEVRRQRYGGSWPPPHDSFATNNFTKSGANRSGVNSSAAALRAAGKVTRRLVGYREKKILVRGGKRLSNKVFNKRIGKWIWQRGVIEITRLKPVYKYTVPKGLDLPPNPLDYTGVELTHVDPPCTITASNVNDPNNKCSYTGYLHGYWAPISGVAMMPVPSVWCNPGVSQRFLDRVDAISGSALTKFYERVKNQKINLAQAIAERAQTTGLLCETVVRLTQGVMAAKKGNFKKAAGILLPNSAKKLSSDWLVYQYGVKPLLSDLEGAAEFLAGKTVDPLLYDVKAGRREELPVATTTYQTLTGVRCTTTYITYGHVQVTYKARMTASDGGRDYSTLGFGNLASLLWELTPYSFVADWFYPLGDYLNTRDAFSNLTVFNITKTVYAKEYFVIIRRFGGVDANGYNWPVKEVRVEGNRVTCKRTLLSTIPVIPYPDMKDPISGIHIANALALITQLFKRGI